MNIGYAATLALSVALSSPVAFATEPTETIAVQNEVERALFKTLSSMCGRPRESLAECPGDRAATLRAEVREQMARGATDDEIRAAYAKKYGSGAVMVPSNEGADQALWIAPLVVAVAGGVLLATVIRRLRRRAGNHVHQTATSAPRDKYDERLERELEEADS